MHKIEFKKPDHYKINYEEYVVPATGGYPEEIRASLSIETDIDLIIKNLEKLKCLK